MSESHDFSDAELLAKIRESYSTKSAQIRALARDGWTRSKIADALGIRYQHVWNVLDDDAEKRAMIVEALMNQKDKTSRRDLDAAKNTAPQLTGLFALGKSHQESEAVNVSTLTSQEIDDALKNARDTSKQSVNLSINSSLLEAARRLPINLSETLESSLVGRLKHEAMVRWQIENREAIEERNKFFETHGLWSDGLRQF